MKQTRRLLEDYLSGSLEAFQSCIRSALSTLEKVTGSYYYIEATFPEVVIASTGGKYYAFPYTVENGNCLLGAPKEVEKEFVVKEGGEGSGNFGHLGRPGKVGGSSGEGSKKASDLKVGDNTKIYGVLKEVTLHTSGDSVEIIGDKDRGTLWKHTRVDIISKKAIRESEIVEIVESAVDVADFEFSDFIALNEDTYDHQSGMVEAILIEAGTNPKKKRHYPSETIKEAAPNFAGLKMYMNHPTSAQEKERPERDLRDWVSTITESYYEDGKAIGKIKVHDQWLKERLNDPIARQHIGLSINTGGKVAKGKVNGEEMQIVEKIVFQRQNGPVSVDWVTEAGARGRVSKLLKESIQQEDEMDFKALTKDQLLKERPDLVEAIGKDLKESSSAEAKDKELKEANDKIAAFEKKEKLGKQKATVDALLKESKLPEPAKERIASEFENDLAESEAELREAVANRIKSELAYINKFSDKGKVKMGAGTPSSEGGTVLKESQTALEARMGIKTEDKEKK